MSYRNIDISPVNDFLFTYTVHKLTRFVDTDLYSLKPNISTFPYNWNAHSTNIGILLFRTTGMLMATFNARFASLDSVVSFHPVPVYGRLAFEDDHAQQADLDLLLLVVVVGKDGHQDGGHLGLSQEQSVCDQVLGLLLDSHAVVDPRHMRGTR